jgi:hypothetical protein
MCENQLTRSSFCQTKHWTFKLTEAICGTPQFWFSPMNKKNYIYDPYMSTGSFLSYTVPNIIKLMDLSTPILSSDGKAHHLLCNIGDFEVAFEFGLRCVLQVFNVLTYTLNPQPAIMRN